VKNYDQRQQFAFVVKVGRVAVRVSSQYAILHGGCYGQIYRYFGICVGNKYRNRYRINSVILYVKLHILPLKPVDLQHKQRREA
jgi:hypothetical protein